MTLRYEALPTTSAYGDVFKVAPPQAPGERHVKPRRTGFMVRAAAAAQEPAAEGDAAPQARELIAAQWGLVPHWVKSASDGRLRAPKLVNAHADTITTSTAFRDAWLNGQRCIVPLQSFYEDDWRSGKAVSTRIARVDGAPMGVAGIWATWTGPEGDTLLSYALITVNANAHALMHRYQRPGAEKRMPVILSEGTHAAWLSAPVAKAKEFLRAYPAQSLTANPVENKADKVPKGWLG